MEDKTSQYARRLSALGASKGGKARAEALTPEQRSELARYAAEKRWEGIAVGLPKETHTGILQIGGREIPCAVLDNETRVLSTRGVNRAVGTRTTGTPRGQREGARHLPYFLASKGIKPFISKELMARVMNPIKYKPLQGGVAFGHEATVLPEICKVIFQANKAGALKASQKYLVETAQVLVEGLATVGIIALVDEATGYQADRAKDELMRILEAYISKELLPWTRRFPHEFFEEVYRLHGWQFRPGQLKGPLYVGKLVNKFIYEKLPPGVLPALQQRNPVTEAGYRKHKHHQFLTPDTGHPHLDKQITAVMTLMRASDDKSEFKRLFDKAFPKQGQQLALALHAGENEE